MTKLQAYLNAPIPRKVALAVIVGQALTNYAVMAKNMQRLAMQANVVILDQQERLHIYHESIDYLLERADPATLLELNKNLDFWRVVRTAKAEEANKTEEN